MISSRSGIGRVSAYVALLLVITAVIFAEDEKSSQAQNTQRGSILKVDSGTLYTATGIPIELHRVIANIKKYSLGKDGKDRSGGNESNDPSRSSEVVTIKTGEVTLTSASLTKLLNEKVGKSGKIENLKLTTDGSKHEVNISGDAKKVINVPFELKGPMVATKSGQIAFDAKTVKAADIPGLAGLLGLTVESAAGKNTAKGVKTEHNTIIFNPDQLWGLPVHGAVSRVAVLKEGLLLVFGQPRPIRTKKTAYQKSQSKNPQPPPSHSKQQRLPQANHH